MNKELTFEEIIEAFEKTGLNPIRGDFYDFKDGKLCGGCILTAYYKNKNMLNENGRYDEDGFEYFPSHLAIREFGKDYAKGVMHGFDDGSYVPVKSGENDYLRGYTLGQEVINHFKKQGLFNSVK